MTTTHTNPYLVVNYVTGHVWDRQPNFDLALASYEAAREHLPSDERLTTLAVRHIDDPRWSQAKNAPPPEYPTGSIGRDMFWAVAKAKKDELRKTARWAVERASEGDWFDGVVDTARQSLKDRGWDFYTNHEVEQAVKDRVTLGRPAGFARGFWWPRREGKLADKRGPNGEYLHQTSLALGGGFRRLPAPEPEPTPDPELPKFVKLDKIEREDLLEIGRRAGDLESAKDAMFDQLINDPRWEHLDAVEISDYAWAAARWAFPREYAEGWR